MTRGDDRQDAAARVAIDASRLSTAILAEEPSPASIDFYLAKLPHIARGLMVGGFELKLAAL